MGCSMMDGPGYGKLRVLPYRNRESFPYVITSKLSNFIFQEGHGVKRGKGRICCTY